MTIFLDEQMKDEPLFGIVARYLEEARHGNVDEIIKRLFGRVCRASSMGMGLDHVARETRVCWGYSPGTIARKMTTFHYFSSLSSPERSSRCLKRMTGNLPSVAKLQQPPATLRTGLHGHRYCKACLLQDRHAGEMPHWRRCHQLPGVIYCHLHGEPLWEAPNQKIRNAHGRFYTCAHGYLSPLIADALGAEPISLDLTSTQTKGCQKIATISSRLLSSENAIDVSEFPRVFAAFMSRTSPYLGGRRRSLCIARLMRECFGDEYLNMHLPRLNYDNFIPTIGSDYSQPLRKVLALALMELVADEPHLVADSRFSDLYDHMSSDEVVRLPALRPLPTMACPSVFAQHGPGHLVEKVGRRPSKIQAACSCGMCFTFVRSAGSLDSMRITRWGPDYAAEIKKLRASGLMPAAIARRLGMPIRTVMNLLEIRGPESATLDPASD